MVKPVGMWTDRKILYAKTVDCGAMPNNTVKDVPHGISNVDKIWVFSGYAHNPTNGYFNPLQLPNDTISGQWYACATASNIKIAAFTDRSSYSDVSVTLFYTKTTDSPLASDEKFAGVTSGGEVIYEKEFSTTEITSGNYFTANLSYNNLLDVRGYADLYAGSELNGCLTFPQTILAGAYEGVYANVKSNMAKTAVVVYFKDGRANPSTAYKLKNVHFTVRYTKSS